MFLQDVQLLELEALHFLSALPFYTLDFLNWLVQDALIESLLWWLENACTLEALLIDKK